MKMKKSLAGSGMKFILTERARTYIAAEAERISREGSTPALAVWTEQVHS